MLTSAFRKLPLLALVIGLSSSYAFADGVEVIGSEPHTLKIQPLSFSGKQQTKVIELLEVELSDKEKALITQRALDAQHHTNQFSAKALLADATLPSNMQLGMNGVPVLDQGVHGSCVTFAVTGALDTVIGKGDYISQLCNLQLGSYLKKFGYNAYSGWDGFYTYALIDQIQQYGIVNNVNQHSKGCGGLTDYPISSAHSDDSFIEPAQYSAMSELIFGKVANWTQITKNNDVINQVKQSLNSGNRIVFGTLLPRAQDGIGGALGKNKNLYSYDTWLLTPEILKDAPNATAAHEMIITGYDDSAVVYDKAGKAHKGLFTVRNSWGSGIGYYGDFYMTYDYFKLLAYEAYSFSPVN